MTELCVFTADPDPLLLESAARVGIAMASYICNPWIGWVSGKLKRGIEFLESRTEPMALWLDGHDSLILKPEAEILALIPQDAVLVAAERNCWPDDSLASRFPISGLKPRYLNAGGYCGPRPMLIDVMKRVLSLANGENDQIAWTMAYLETYNLTYKGPRIVLDRERRVFCSLGDGDGYSADSCVFHWNGRIPGREEWWRRYIASH